jgi:hydrophobe/amphiphile efflux-1 (HAE1) family protein
MSGIPASTGRRSRRRGLPSWAITKPIGTLALTSIVLVLGAMFVTRLPLDLLPRIVYPQIRVSVTNDGVEPGVLEETVAKPLEAALSSTEDLVRLETEVQESRVGINMIFEYGTDIDLALQNASTNLDRARSRLPEEAEPPTIYKSDPSQSPIFDVAFSSSRDLVSLRSWVEDRLRPQLLTVPGVASVDVSGGLIREIQITLDQERMQSYGLTVSQIIDALRAQNLDVAAGRVSSEQRELVGKTSGKFRSVNDIRAVLLDVGGGRRVPLTEVANVADTHQDQRLWARLDGEPAVKVSIRKQPDANTVLVADAVDARLKELNANRFIPRDMTFQVIQNQASFIRNSVNSVRDAALLGAILAMLVVLVFLQSIRKTLVIGLAIPLAILATFVLMGLGNLTLNIMSLGGLALGVGMLVDNSIVMLENIFRKRDEEGILDPEEAAHEGAGEVQNAVVASTATHLAAVVPFLLISGLSALLFRELILTISFAILASLGVALTLVPMLSAQLSKVRFTSGLSRRRSMQAFERGMDATRRGYRRSAEAALRYPWLVMGAALVMLFGSAFFTRNLGNQFLPPVDDGRIGVSINLPPGATPEQTNAIALETERMVRQMPDVVSVFATAGGFLFGGSTADRSGRGSLDVGLKPASERSLTADSWVKTLQDRIDARGFPGARVFVRPPRIRGLRTSFSGSDVSLSVQGDELIELQQIAKEISTRVQGVPGLENLEESSDDASQQLSVRLNRERAGFLGLDVVRVGQTLRTALDGTIATKYTEGNREYDVRVRLPRDKFTSPEQLGSVALFPGGGGRSPVFLRDVADVQTVLGPTEIRRENQNRVLRLNGDVITEIASIGEVNDSIRARLATLELPDGYSIVMGGEEQAIKDNNQQLTIVALLAVFLVFVVLAILYESLINPLVILLAIPLSLIGVGFALWITQTPLSAPVLLGVILLAGIVVNNSILLVDYVEEYRRERGISPREALVAAGAVRLRPIVMTTLTTLLGMMPLAMGIGEGSELMQPLAIAVVGGLTVSTLLTLYVVPSAYLLMHGGAARLSAWLLGSRSRPAQMPHGATPAAGD